MLKPPRVRFACEMSIDMLRHWHDDETGDRTPTTRKCPPSIVTLLKATAMLIDEATNVGFSSTSPDHEPKRELLLTNEMDKVLRKMSTLK